MYIYIYVYVYMYIYMYTYVYIHMYIYICVHIYIYICMYMYLQMYRALLHGNSLLLHTQNVSTLLQLYSAVVKSVAALKRPFPLSYLFHNHESMRYRNWSSLGYCSLLA